MKVWVVIPALNEAESLAKLLDAIQGLEVSTLVIDDGSRDGTLSIAKEKADAVIHNERNRGKGVALNVGFTSLLEQNDWDYAITMDADGQHSPEDLDKFLVEANRGASFVVGNRMHNPQGMPFLRIMVNKCMSAILSFLAHQKIPDTQCGFRLIKREVLKKMIIETKKFEVESELIIKAARLGFNISNVPIQSIYFFGRHSRISPFVDTIRFFRFIVRGKYGHKE